MDPADPKEKDSKRLVDYLPARKLLTGETGESKKFCIDCKWAEQRNFKVEEFSLCLNPAGKEVSPVTGVYTQQYCCARRAQSRDACGPEGLLWEKRGI